MRIPNLGSVSYNPNQVPDDPAAIPMFLYEELAYIAAQIRLLADGQIDVTHVAPDKPRDGMLRNADGTDWNPGSGAGLYRYGGGVWNFLG